MNAAPRGREFNGITRWRALQVANLDLQSQENKVGEA